ncbi:MAG: PrgI family protein [Candidatus Berkelbacteria bacterium]
MEDKVIGPLTLTQFFYLLFGGLFLYLLNSWTAGTPLRVIYYLLFPIVATLSIALAFVKIQERPFIYFLGSLVKYLQRPRRRVWLKGQYKREVQIVNKVEEKTEQPHKQLDRARVRDIARVVDDYSDGPEA